MVAAAEPSEYAGKDPGLKRIDPLRAQQINSVELSTLPSTSQRVMELRQSSFFRSFPSRELPTPAEVRDKCRNWPSCVAIYEDLALAVKYGSHQLVHLEGALAMYAVRQVFDSRDIPVPELFGWCWDEDQIFVYMSLIPGDTIRNCWPLLEQGDIQSICDQLRSCLLKLQGLVTDCPQPFIGKLVAQLGRPLPTHMVKGSINRGPVRDNHFMKVPDMGPFDTVQEFNDAVQEAAIPCLPTSQRSFDDPYRSFLHDDYKICFTHGDIHIGNVMIAKLQGAWQITGIIDWDQAGFYPEYWEACKIQFGVEQAHEWRSAGWADQILGTYEDEMDGMMVYWQWRGP